MSTLPLPDPALHDVGLDDGGQRGAKQVRLLEHVGLTPAADLLEIGCGLGRLAYELATYFDGGSYTGFDISAEAIDWLNAEYAPRLPGFEATGYDVAERMGLIEPVRQAGYQVREVRFVDRVGANERQLLDRRLRSHDEPGAVRSSARLLRRRFEAIGYRPRDELVYVTYAMPGR